MGSDDIARVTDGVFFRVSRTDLPHGRHDLPREEVLTRQRERAMIAATELLAHGGYRSVSVGAVCTRASLSRAAFYDCFADKDACIFAAYDRFIDTLLQRLAAAGTPDMGWHAYVAAVIEAYLGTLQLDLVVARAFQVELDALGRPARRRRRESLVGLARLLQERHHAWLGRDPGFPFTDYLGGVYAVRQLAADALDQDAAPDLLALLPDLAGWVGRAFAE